MQKIRSWIAAPAVLALALVAPASLAAQEHPTGGPAKPMEHPAKPAEHPKAKPVSTATLEKAIREQIEEKTKADGGTFKIHDAVLNKDWALTLVRVHTDKLTQLDADTYFACTDFRAEDGTLVDIDFYMKEKDGKLALSDTTIHKVNGKPRFNYEKKNGYWERVAVKS
jgi:hypothetical protein